MPARLGLIMTALVSISIWEAALGQEGASAAPAKSTPIPKEAPRPSRDLSKLSPLQRQMEISAQRGAEWLFRSNRADGSFVPGYIPSLQKLLEADDYLRQAGAAFALARAARHSGNERWAARARQAVLTLLLDTATDPNDPRVRRTSLPPTAVNRLGAAGMLVLAIHELPDPGADMLEQSDQLCAYIARQQQTDGSLRIPDISQNAEPAVNDRDLVNRSPGIALYGLARSQIHRPAPWKADIIRKALVFYRTWWQSEKSMGFVPWQTAAFAEAYAQNKDPACADFVFELADWLSDLQYARLDPRHPLWVGGFMSFAEGKPAHAEPTIESALYAGALADACRAARLKGDVARCARYSAAVRAGLQFVTTLQYTELNTGHFADGYRPILVGGFHASHQNGDLRIDHTAHAVSAMMQFLSYVAE